MRKRRVEVVVVRNGTGMLVGRTNVGVQVVRWRTEVLTGRRLVVDVICIS